MPLLVDTCKNPLMRHEQRGHPGWLILDRLRWWQAVRIGATFCIPSFCFGGCLSLHGASISFDCRVLTPDLRILSSCGRRH
ncbi:hypothetical protein P9112_010011 [Eukaryota sp. TZLM1-RC]